MRLLFFTMLNVCGVLAIASAEETVISLADCVQFVERRQGWILDTRPADIYQRGHIPGALNLPLKDFEAGYQRLKGRLEADFSQRLLVYCTSVNCIDSEKAREKLAGKGFTRVVVFQGGYAAWWKAGFPVAKGEEPGRYEGAGN